MASDPGEQESENMAHVEAAVFNKLISKYHTITAAAGPKDHI